MKKNTDFQSLLIGCVITLYEALLIKVLQFKILPAKYFYDSKHILAIMNGSKDTDTAFSFTANFFNKINLLHFTTLEEWSYCIAFIFSIILFIILIKSSDRYTITQYAFIYASVGLLNIYVFNLSKDIIQFIFFFVIYWILLSKMHNYKKIILICAILVYESLNFRSYYLIMASLIITMYLIYLFFVNDKNISFLTIIEILLIGIIMFFVEVYVVQLISVDNYNQIMHARESVNEYRENSIDAVTIINEPFGTNINYGVFIGNYIVNFIRMAFPFELMFKGVKYIPFIIYQLFLDYNVLKLGTRINKRNILWLIVVLSFMMISVIFEPDFGSFIRHETAMTLFFIYINKIINRKRKKLEYGE